MLAEWDTGRLDVLYPPSHMMPWLALYKHLSWSRERGETKQHELIGMSASREASRGTRLMSAINDTSSAE